MFKLPDELEAALIAEAERRGKPWTVSSVIVQALEQTLGRSSQEPPVPKARPAQTQTPIGKGYVEPRPKGGKR